MKRAGVALSLVVCATAFAGCPCIDDTINSSPWLKWKIFAAFGADRVCAEMTRRGAPLRLADGGNVIGRFFPTGCQTSVNDDAHTVTLGFTGEGYAWTIPTRRMSFNAQGRIDYKPDFHKDGGTVYVWFSPIGAPDPQFSMGYVEQAGVDLLSQMSVFGFNPTQWIATQFVKNEMGKGFTVIHESSGDDFALGILQPPQRPPHPYDAHGSDRVFFANETAEVHSNTLDFVGPFEIDAAGRTLFTRFRVNGPAVDVAIVTRDVGDAWRRAYQAGPGVPMPPGAPIAASPVPANVEVDRSMPLPKGQYYVVIDNSPYVGQVAPPQSATLPLPGMSVFDPVAQVTYLVSMGDTP